MPETVTEGVIVPLASLSTTPLPVFRGNQMIEALTAYRELQAALDKSMPDQLMDLDGKAYRKKGYWRALAVAFNLTVEPIDEKRDVYGELEDGSDNYGWVVTYRASTPSGRAATGDGACAAAEKQRGRMKASEHNVRAHAHTRAYNRAVSNLVGFGEVSAEEVEHPSDQDSPPSTRQSQHTPPERRAVASGHGTDLLISEAQAKRLYAIANDAGWDDADLKAWLEEVWGMKSSKQIPRRQYEEIVNEVRKGPDLASEDGQ